MRKIKVVVQLVQQLQHGFTKNAKVSPNLTVAQISIFSTATILIVSDIISVQDNHVWRLYCMNDDVLPKLVCFSLSNFVKIMYLVFTPSKKFKLSDHMCITHYIVMKWFH